MKYYATITHRSGQFEIGGTAEDVIRDLKALKCSGRIDGSEIISIYGVDLRTGTRLYVGCDETEAILREAGL